MPSLRKRYLPLVAALGCGAAVLPTLAAGQGPASTASFTARDNVWEVTGTSDRSATIAVGGTVTFAYPTGASQHNVAFDAAAPSTCSQTSGPSSGSVPPLPASVTAPGWAGTCTFTTPGTYAFHCDLHAAMTGTVVVVDPAAPTPPTTTTSTTTTTTAPTTPAPTGPAAPPAEAPTTTSPTTTTPPPVAAAPLAALDVARNQRGAVVRGVIVVGRAGRLTVEARRGTQILGRARARTVAAGRRRFAIALNAAARRAVQRRGRLTVAVRATLTTPTGPTARRTVSVVVRPAR